MQNEPLFDGNGGFFKKPGEIQLPFLLSRQGAIGAILIVALLAFELFNFDTTRYALSDLLGSVNFIGIPWAAILAVAFCAIDFAGLAHLFAPDREQVTARESWYLMGAWLLGATMNALMTWWAVNLTLIHNQFGNEVLSREQLLNLVPPFVAVLVWLTRILFIGAFSMAGEHFFRQEPAAAPQPQPFRGQRPAAGTVFARTPATPRPSANASRREMPAHHSRRQPPLPAGAQRAPSVTINASSSAPHDS